MAEIPGSNLLLKVIDGEERLAVSYSQIETFLQCPYKWFRTYILGEREQKKQEATSYGSVVHKTLEYFFKNKRLPCGEDLGKAITYYAHEEDIPWDDPKNMIEAMRQSGELLAWIVELFQKNENNRYVRPKIELNPVEKMIRYADIEGVEEGFNIPYRLPVPVNINGEVYTHVYINGSIDLHLSKVINDKKYHYVIDWKSGKKLFDSNKLNTNLQHPIYSFYIYRKYGDGYPCDNIYFFTRTREYQRVNVDKERVKKSIEILDNVFYRMYNFEDRVVDSYMEYVEKYGRYTKRKANLNQPVLENMKPCPSALCYFCDFGLHYLNKCEYSSDWDMSKKVKR